MLVDAELNSLLLKVIEINKYNKKCPSRYSVREIDNIFQKSIEDITRYYTKFVNTTNEFEQEIDITSIKVYLRLFPTTGNWYIGYTRKKFADKRHTEDLREAKKTTDEYYHTKLIDFYKKYAPYIPVMIFTVCQVKDLKTALLLEEKLIDYFTNPSNNTPLPINLCLNTQYKYCPPPKPKRTSTSKRTPRLMPKIVKIEDCLDEKGRMFLEQLLNMKRISTSPFEITFTEHCKEGSFNLSKDDIVDTDW